MGGAVRFITSEAVRARFWASWVRLWISESDKAGWAIGGLEARERASSRADWATRRACSAVWARSSAGVGGGVVMRWIGEIGLAVVESCDEGGNFGLVEMNG